MCDFGLFPIPLEVNVSQVIENQLYYFTTEMYKLHCVDLT